MNPRLAATSIVLGAAAAIAIVPPAWSQGGAQPLSEVTVVRATNACFSATIRVTGFLVARTAAMVTLDAPGARVTEVLASVGDRVTVGQTLVRYTRLVTEGPDVGKSTTSTLRSPVAGTVTRSTAVVGATASPMVMEPLYRIAVDNDIELEADVPSIHVPALATGQSARIEIVEGRELAGKVRLVPATIDQRTQLGRARVSVERDSSLQPGMFARATILRENSCGIKVPHAAVRFLTEGASVQIVRNDLIETRKVQLGLYSDDEDAIEVRSGLRDGDMVVAKARGVLQDGDKVKVNETSMRPGGQR
jgi:multidrug efflux pump subunit AcrA (membrane-fusion protein)